MGRRLALPSLPPLLPPELRICLPGFDSQPEEIREPVAERYGSELTPKQLDQIAGGTEPFATIYDPSSALGSLGSRALLPSDRTWLWSRARAATA